MKSIAEWTLYLVVGIFLLLVVLIVGIGRYVKHRHAIDEANARAHKNLQTVADATLALVATEQTPLEGDDLRSVKAMRGQHSAEHGKHERLLRSILGVVQYIARRLGLVLDPNTDHPVPKKPPAKEPPPGDTQ